MAELIVERASAEKEHMGLTTWENASDGKIVKLDVSIAKNYLNALELEDMGRFPQNLLNSLQNQSTRSIESFRTDCLNLILTISIRSCWIFQMIFN